MCDCFDVRTQVREQGSVDQDSSFVLLVQPQSEAKVAEHSHPTYWQD